MDPFELFQLFTSVDSDVNGLISPDELYTLFDRLEYKCTDNQRAIVESVDQISFTMFLDIVNSNEVDDDLTPYDVFKQYDTEDNGQISVINLTALLMKSKLLTEDQIDQILRDLDVDDDKMVDYTKLIAHVE